MTETRKHTPGPWTREGSKVYRQTKGGGACGLIATVFDDDSALHLLDPEAIEANARLIASAPDLLEALKAIVEEHLHTSFPPYEPGESPYDKGRAAIAKATGDSE